jgi:hypothetical protein
VAAPRPRNSSFSGGGGVFIDELSDFYPGHVALVVFGHQHPVENATTFPVVQSAKATTISALKRPVQNITA